MSKALIYNGVVEKIIDKEFEVCPGLSFVDIPALETVQVGYTYANGSFSPPGPEIKPLPDQMDETKQMLITMGQFVLNEIDKDTFLKIFNPYRGLK